MRGKRSLGALALTLALVLGLAAPAFAAQLRLTYQMNSGGNAANDAASASNGVAFGFCV